MYDYSTAQPQVTRVRLMRNLQVTCVQLVSDSQVNHELCVAMLLMLL